MYAKDKTNVRGYKDSIRPAGKSEEVAIEIIAAGVRRLRERVGASCIARYGSFDDRVQAITNVVA